MLKRLIHRSALRAEALIDRVRPESKRPPVLEAYRGYATPDHLVVRGRVLTALRRETPDDGQGRWTNFRQMVSLFLTDEVRDISVTALDHGISALSDEEGYLTLCVPRRDASAGWVEVAVAVVGREGEAAPFPVRVPSEEARFGIISDIDDTLIHTGAHSLARNLWTTFTGSTLTRKVFPDSVELLTALADRDANPVFYVSSSPWNLHHFLDTVFAQAGLPKGPMFLRDLGISETQFISGRHGDHKGGAIDTILDANPDLPFVLIGDTGQHDAEVYRDATRRHPGRIRAVALRQLGKGPDRVSRAAMAEIEADGIPLFAAPTFAGAADGIGAGLPTD